MLKPGDTFERYTIEAPLGQGGMGCVYRAHDARLGRRVALKVISDGQRDGQADAEANARLLREARAAAALDHPNAVAIFDVGEYEGTPFIVMELVSGRTLRSTVGDTSVPAATCVAELADVARALAVAHKRGLVHRDIKPENVMVREDGVVKVLDFGIARRQGSIDPHETETPALPTLTIEGVKLGTPVYMAPEQIRGDALDGRTDQFAWGVVAYELLAGRLPWRGSGDAMAVMASVLTDRVDRAPLDQAEVPRAVQDVVLRALEKRPDDRFPSMNDVAQALDAAVREGDKPGSAKPRQARKWLPQGATEAQRFSTGEVRDVLAKAIDQQAERQGSTKLGFEDLLAVAAEVGIDPDSLREASRALRASKQDPSATGGDFVKKRDAWIRQQRLTLYRHAGVYGIINAAILVLGLVLLSFTPWWIWFLPLLGWGIGLAIHALVALTASDEDFRQHDDGMKWWHENQRRQHEERMARRAPHEAPRIEAPAERAGARFELSPGKVRVAPADTGRERDADEEAAAMEEGRKGEQRRR
jgi:serine/threonine protein kinase